MNAPTTASSRPTLGVNATRFLSGSTRSSNNALLFVVCLAQFMVILDVAVVNVALPSMRSGLHFSTTGLQWVLNVYTITFAGFLMLGGRSADLVAVLLEPMLVLLLRLLAVPNRRCRQRARARPTAPALPAPAARSAAVHLRRSPRRRDAVL